MIVLTREEAQELFARCLRSQEDDNAASTSILRKLGHALEADEPAARLAA